MPRVALDLNKDADRRRVKGRWRFGPGLVPGEPNEGLTSQVLASPARLADYDDSAWQVCTNVRQSTSKGFTFAWYRIAVELPRAVDGMEVAGSRAYFETNFDNYGEVWIDGQLNRTTGAIMGLNAHNRVEIENPQPGGRHVIACLVLNGPIAEPRGGIFLRYATLAFESTG